MYDKLSINIIDLLYKDLNRFKLYGDFNTKISLLEYYKNYLINNGEATYLLRYDDETIDTSVNANYIIMNKLIYSEQPKYTNWKFFESVNQSILLPSYSNISHHLYNS